MRDLITESLTEFVRKKYLYEGDNNQSLKTVSELVSLDGSEKEVLKFLNLVDLDTKAKLLFSGSLFPNKDVETFRSQCI